MAHLLRDKKRILNRVHRIQGQLSAVAKALDEDQESATILQTIAACRGAINGLMAEVIEGHIHHHLASPDHAPSAEQRWAARELIDIVKTYLR